MSSILLADLIAQASIDPDLEAKLVACAGSLENFLEVAKASGYALTKESLSSMSDLSDHELASVIGGGCSGDGGQGGKGTLTVIGLIRELQSDIKQP